MIFNPDRDDAVVSRSAAALARLVRDGCAPKLTMPLAPISLITDYFPPRECTRALAVYSFGIPVGSALGVFIGGSMVSRVDWRTAFFAIGVFGLFLLPIFRLTMREPVRRAVVLNGVAADGMAFGELLKLVAGKPSFWAMCLGASSCSVIGYGFAFWLPSFFTRSHHLGQGCQDHTGKQPVFLAF